MIWVPSRMKLACSAWLRHITTLQTKHQRRHRLKLPLNSLLTLHGIWISIIFESHYCHKIGNVWNYRMIQSCLLRMTQERNCFACSAWCWTCHKYVTGSPQRSKRGRSSDKSTSAKTPHDTTLAPPTKTYKKIRKRIQKLASSSLSESLSFSDVETKIDSATLKRANDAKDEDDRALKRTKFISESPPTTPKDCFLCRASMMRWESLACESQFLNWSNFVAMLQLHYIRKIP